MPVPYGSNTRPYPVHHPKTLHEFAHAGAGEHAVAAMAVINTEHLAQMMDPGNQAKVMQQAADEAKRSLESANAALQAGEVTLELSKDVAPLLTQMKAVTAKLELIDQRLQAIESKSGGCCIVS